MNRRQNSPATVRTGTCTECRQPVTAVQSARDTRTWTGRHTLTHLNQRDCTEAQP